MRAHMTIAEFNAAMQAEGMTMELVKGAGYFYFRTLEPMTHYTVSEYVYAFKHLTPAQWMERAREAWRALANPTK